MPPSSSRVSDLSMLEHGEFLRALARSLVWDEHRADDVVQDTWVTALERRGLHHSSAKGWLARVAQNLARRTAVREGERPHRERDAARPEASEVDAEGRDLEQQRLVLEALRALRQPYRTTLYLRYYKDLGPNEIAAHEGVSVATVKTRLRRGLELLREDLDRSSGGDRRSWTLALAPFAGLAPGSAPAGSMGATSLIHGVLWMNKSILAAVAAVVVAGVATLVWYTNQGGTQPTRETVAAAEDERLDDGLRPEAELTDDGVAPDVERPTGDRSAVEVAPDTTPVPDAAATARLLRGRVVDEFGHPVAGAEVQLSGGTSEWFFASGVSLVRGDRDASTTTDTQGEFSLQVEGSGASELRVGADGFAPFRIDVALEEDRDSDVGDLELETGVHLSGRVVDSNGHPVAGARVSTSGRELGGGLVLLAGAGATQLLATTDGAGQFEIDRLAAGPWRLRVESDEHPVAQLDGETSRPGERVDGLVVELEAGFEIAGRITGLPFDASDDLRVVARREMPSDGAIALRIDELGVLDGRGAPIASDGTFRIRGLSADTAYTVRAVEGRSTWNPESRSSRVTAQAGDLDVQLVYAHPAAIEFQVADAQTGEPITEMNIEAGAGWRRPLLDERGRPRTVFPDGRVRIEDFGGLDTLQGDRPVTARVGALGYELWESEPVRLVEGQVVDLGTIYLDEAPVVRLKVAELASGDPIAGARVTLSPWEEPGMAGNGFTREVRIAVSADGGDETVTSTGFDMEAGTTDENGEVVLPSRPGERVTLRVQSPSHAPWRSEVVELPMKTDYVELVRLVPGSTVTVRVLDADGEPLPGERVEHRSPGTPSGPFEFDELMGEGRAENLSDSEGRVLFENLEEGLHRFRLAKGSSGAISFQIAGGPDPGGPWTELEVVGGTDGELELRAAPRGGIAGVVTEGGLPLAGATVSLAKPMEGPLAGLGLPFQGDSLSARTDGRGRYAFDGVEVGSWEMTVDHPSRAMSHEEEFEVLRGENDGDVDLAVTIVRGRVTDAEGEPVAGARVTAERVSPGGPGGAQFGVRTAVMMVTDDGEGETIISTGMPEASETRTDADGNYELRGVADSTPLEILVEGSAFAPTRSDRIELAPNEERDGVDLAVRPAGTIRVRAIHPDGTPAPGFLAVATFEGETDSPVEPINGFAQGNETTLSGCREGVWRVSVSPFGQGAISIGGGASGPSEEVEVIAGEEAFVEVEVDP